MKIKLKTPTRVYQGPCCLKRFIASFTYEDFIISRRRLSWCCGGYTHEMKRFIAIKPFDSRNKETALYLSLFWYSIYWESCWG